MKLFCMGMKNWAGMELLFGIHWEPILSLCWYAPQPRECVTVYVFILHSSNRRRRNQQVMAPVYRVRLNPVCTLHRHVGAVL